MCRLRRDDGGVLLAAFRACVRLGKYLLVVHARAGEKQKTQATIGHGRTKEGDL